MKNIVKKVLMVSGVIFFAVSFNNSSMAMDGHEHAGKHGTHSATKADSGKGYPLDTCVVSGAKLGSMGDPVIHIYKGQEIKLCCKGCLDTVKNNPEKYLKIVKDAYDEKNKKR